MRVVRAAAAAVVLALLGLLVWDVTHNGHGGVAAKVDKGHTVTAPKTALPFFGTRSGTFDLAAYRGKVVVLNFWASDCVPCKQEQGELNRLATKYASKGVVFLGMDEIEVRSFAQHYLSHYKVPYQSVADGDGAIAGKYGVTGTPETFFIDRLGRAVPPHIVAQASVSAIEAGIQRALKA